MKKLLFIALAIVTGFSSPAQLVKTIQSDKTYDLRYKTYVTSMADIMFTVGSCKSMPEIVLAGLFRDTNRVALAKPGPGESVMSLTPCDSDSYFFVTVTKEDTTNNSIWADFVKRNGRAGIIPADKAIYVYEETKYCPLWNGFNLLHLTSWLVMTQATHRTQNYMSDSILQLVVTLADNDMLDSLGGPDYVAALTNSVKQMEGYLQHQNEKLPTLAICKMFGTLPAVKLPARITSADQIYIKNLVAREMYFLYVDRNYSKKEAEKIKISVMSKFFNETQ